MGVVKLKTKISAAKYLEDEIVRQTRHEFTIMIWMWTLSFSQSI